MATLLGLVVPSLFLLPAPSGSAQEPVRVELIGDSLLRMTYESDTSWNVNAWDGRSLHNSTALLTKIAGQGPDAIVAALGSNDVAEGRRPQAMSTDVALSVRATVEVPCVVFTTVTIYGSPFYNRRWAEHARTFNRVLWDSGAHVANWNKEVRLHPSYLLNDGLHPSLAGEAAYDRLLRDTVARLCGIQT